MPTCGPVRLRVPERGAQARSGSCARSPNRAYEKRRQVRRPRVVRPVDQARADRARARRHARVRPAVVVRRADPRAGPDRLSSLLCRYFLTSSQFHLTKECSRALAPESRRLSGHARAPTNKDLERGIDSARKRSCPSYVDSLPHRTGSEGRSVIGPGREARDLASALVAVVDARLRRVPTPERPRMKYQTATATRTRMITSQIMLKPESAAGAAASGGGRRGLGEGGGREGRPAGAGTRRPGAWRFSVSSDGQPDNVALRQRFRAASRRRQPEPIRPPTPA